MGNPIRNGADVLVRNVRAGLLVKGFSLAKWSAEQGVSANWVRHCLSGKATGPAAQKMATQVREAAGVRE